jgi:hypothetical protein
VPTPTPGPLPQELPDTVTHLVVGTTVPVVYPHLLGGEAVLTFFAKLNRVGADSGCLGRAVLEAGGQAARRAGPAAGTGATARAAPPAARRAAPPSASTPGLPFRHAYPPPPPPTDQLLQQLLQGHRV